MFPPFNEEKARHECQLLMQKLDEERCVFKDINNSDKYSIENLFNSIGQMFGTCVCIDDTGNEVVLKAFSGQYNSIWNIPGWVPPLLNTDDFYSMTKESDRLIHELTDSLSALKKEIEQMESSSNTDIKLLKKARREYSELHSKRKKMSRQSMKEIFTLYKVHCFDGSVKTFKDIFGEERQPPTGCGECCAPKLLDYAFSHNLTPVSLAEFYYGSENNSSSKKHKQFYAPCDEKCGLLLPVMLGLEILYRDEHIIVINKQSGLLSIPGRGEDKSDSATSRLKKLFPQSIPQPSVHRLDMDTSGLLVMAFTKEAHKNLSIQFMNGNVSKKYLAVLRGKINPGDGCSLLQYDNDNLVTAGHTELPFRLDIEHRPYQIYDETYGKIGITDWKILNNQDSNEYECLLSQFKFLPSQDKEKNEMYKKVLEGEYTLIKFSPATGRTHQLRVHSAHEKGLNCPIVGDNLYGTQLNNERLLLHAFELSFIHPITNEKMYFSTINNF